MGMHNFSRNFQTLSAVNSGHSIVLLLSYLLSNLLLEIMVLMLNLLLLVFKIITAVFAFVVCFCSVSSYQFSDKQKIDSSFGS